MDDHSQLLESDIRCFLCEGTGKITKDRLYKELGVKQLADVAKMSVKETLDGLNKDGFKFFQTYKDELTKTIEQRFASQLEAEATRNEREHQRQAEEKDALRKQVIELSAQIVENQGRTKLLEDDLARARATPAKKGEQGEVDFVSFAQQYRDLKLSQKLSKAGDYLLSVQVEGADGIGLWVNEIALIDVKKDKPLGAEEINGLSRDAASRKKKIGFLVATSPDQLKGKDPIPPLQQRNGIFIVCVAMENFPLFVDLLRPFLKFLEAGKPELGEEAWQAKYNVVIGEITQAFIMVQEVLEYTRKIRDQVESVDRIVEKVKKRLQAFCTGSIVNAA